MTVATFTQPDYTTQSDSSAYPVNIDAAIRVVSEVGADFAPHEQSTPDMTVRVDDGSILNGTTYTEVAAQSTGTITAPTTNDRIDRIVIDQSTGSVSVITGSEAASPVAPSITDGKFPVASVALTPGQTSIVNADISDERVGFFLFSSGNVMGSDTQYYSSGPQTAAAGEVIIADTSGGGFTVNLPASPSQGDYVRFDVGADYSANNLTVGRNGETIMGDAADLIVSTNNSFALRYDGTDWRIA